MTKKHKKPGPPKKPEPLKQTSKDFRLVSRDTEKMPVELSQDERDKCAIHLAELVEEKEALDEEKREAMRGWRVKLRAKQEEIDDCAAGVIRGAKPTPFSIETRAVFKTRMIERVRAEDGKVVEKRPMTPEEEVQYLQTDIGESARAQPASLLREPAPTAPVNEDEPEAVDGDTLPDDECEAIGVPHRWPKAWVDRKWSVDGAENPLTGGDVAQVYLTISGAGSTLDQLDEHPSCTWLGRAAITRALALLLRRKLVENRDGVWFASIEAPEVQTEPGKNDTLPEAGDVKRPKRGGAKTKADKMVNTALEQSEGYAPVN